MPLSAENGDLAHEPADTIPRMKSGMALRAACVWQRGQQHAASVLHMAGSARGSENLVGVMNRTIVARQTGVIAHLGGEECIRGHVACAAALRENGVRRRHPARAVNFVITNDAVAHQPDHRYGERDERKYEAPRAQRAGALEIVQVNALRESFGCGFRSGHDRSLKNPLLLR